MIFQILISTMNGMFYNNKINVPAEYLIINQYTDKPNQNENIFNFKERGLSKSRNHALELCQADIALISDDDIRYMDDIEKIILEAFDENKDADIITFQIQTPEGEVFKKYKITQFWHTHKTLMGVCSVEIAFRVKKIRNSNIKFDEEFGLGATFPTGEENIFLTDALNKGLKILYIPIPVVIHPLESSGMDYDNITLTKAKGAMLYRIFGLLGYAVSILFTYKKYKESKYSFRKFVTIMLSGINQYRSNT
jgi:glycosyltransferase involved in cell wall biosynthesis